MQLKLKLEKYEKKFYLIFGFMIFCFLPLAVLGDVFLFGYTPEHALTTNIIETSCFILGIILCFMLFAKEIRRGTK